MTKASPYREELFQWIWQQLEFDCSQLKTVCGKSLHIVDTGQWNHGAGPDFLGAHIQINERDWFGSVEIHKKAIEWHNHKHHRDKNFNSVILHVVYEDDQKESVKTQDGHKPFSLELKLYITKKMHRLLEAKQQNGIACAGNVSFINQEAFKKQIESAHQEYLEYKIEELLEFYDPSMPLSTAWKNCLIMGVYITLGIPGNKNQMAGLAQKIMQGAFSENESSFIENVQKVAFGAQNKISWVHSGMRPASRPKPRVKQAAALHQSIFQMPFQDFFKNGPHHSWSQITENVESALLPGKSRLCLIKQIVFLPALRLLGDLLHSTSLKTSASEVWRSSSQHVPQEMKRPFRKAGFDLNQTTNVIGLAHQYKRYCTEKNCHRCEVFKKAIRS